MPAPNGPPRDPLERYAKPLAAVLIAVTLSLFIAAMIGGAMPFDDYNQRALVYIGCLLYAIVGAFVVFRLVAESEQSLAPGRILKWTVSLWAWPILLVIARKRR